MLRKIRTILAIVVLALLTLLFVDFTGTMQWASVLGKIQFLPAVLAVNLIIVAVLIVLTLVFGRIYCSVICPLGILQDLFARLNRKKLPYSFSKAKNWLRTGVLIVFVACMLLGATSLAALIAPYSTFGRICQNLLQPVWMWGNNLLAMAAEKMDSYALGQVDVWIHSWPTFVISAVTLVVIAVLAIRGGRTWCNTICPVGTVLGFLSRFSWLKISIDTDKCINCGKCAKKCKASCIDSKNHKVDYSRCVVCGNCLENCTVHALSYKHVPCKAQAQGEANGHDAGRRAFVVGAALAGAGATWAQEKKKVDGGLAPILDKVAPERQTALVPPGALSAAHMQQNCTACQLCVSKCPENVLRPSTKLTTLMQPEMSYERGYCRPECNACSEVCPTGAIKPITLEEKSSTQIGHAVWIKKNCIPVVDGVPCNACESHCPVAAITLVPLNPDDEKSVKIPTINEARCIGCGACENLCPARPYSAIYVEGHEVHKEI